MRLSISTLLLLSALASPAAWAQPDPDAVRESVVQVVVMRGGEIERLGSGFVVAEGGYVVTAAHLVAEEASVFVVPLATGAELLARQSYIDERAGLALLAVNGLESPALKLAQDGFDPGRLVYSAGVWSDSVEPVRVAEAEQEVPVALAEGSVGRHLDLPGEDEVPSVPILEHNAMIPAAGYGGPLLNECGEVAGLNRGAPDASRRRLRRGLAPEGVVHALRVAAITGLLQPQGVEVGRSDTSCAGALAAAQAEAEARRQQLEEAAGEVEETRRQLEEATGAAEATREQLEQTQQEKEEAAARATDAQTRVGDLEAQYEEAVRTGDEQAGALRTELETARGDREMAQAAVGTLEDELAALQQRLEQEAAEERSRLMAIGIGAGVLLLALLAAVVVVHRRRSRQVARAEAEAARARQEAAAARAEAQRGAPDHPDCLLTGETGDGNPVSVKIPGRLLGGDGAVIGRSPRNSTLLIDDRTLSREHARLFVDEDVLYLEDLGSTNGTRVNGRDLGAGAPVPVRPGDAIELGAVKVELARTI